MRGILTILTAASFSLHVLWGCGCGHSHAHDAGAAGESGSVACGGHHHDSVSCDAEHGATHDVWHDAPSHQPLHCQCGYCGCVFVVGPKVTSTIAQDEGFALVEIAPTRGPATLPPSPGCHAGGDARSGPPLSIRSHLLLQILLV